MEKSNENIVVLIFLVSKYFSYLLAKNLPENFATYRNFKPRVPNKEGLIKGTYI